jgi:hypothetical protein
MPERKIDRNILASSHAYKHDFRIKLTPDDHEEWRTPVLIIRLMSQC